MRGNTAASQFQLDFYGEVTDALHTARKVGLPPTKTRGPAQDRS